MSRVAEKVPGWVERLLIPTLESKVRSIVKEEVGHLEKVMDARFEAVNSKMDARFEAVNTRIDSLEKRFPAVQELAEIRARLNQIEKSGH
jgi:predicted nucleotidyltransferase